MKIYRTFFIISLLVLSGGINAADYMYGAYDGSYDAKTLGRMCQKVVHRESYKYDPYYDDAFNDDEMRYDDEMDQATEQFLEDLKKSDAINKKKKTKSQKNNSVKKKSSRKSSQQQQHQRLKKSNFQQQRSNIASNKVDVKKIASMSVKERTAVLHKAIKDKKLYYYCCQLLEAGVDTSVTNKNGKTVLYKAVARRKYDFIQKLLQKGADSSIATNQGYTPLHKAIIRDSIESVKLLFQFKANPSVVNEDGDSPLHIAVMNDCFECADALVKAGSDALLVNKKGLTPFDIARQANNKKMILLLDVHSSSGNNIPAAAASSSSRNKKNIRTAKSRLLQMQKDELSLLQVSVKNDTEAVQKLLKMHVDPNCPTVTEKDKKAYGGSPLCNAVEHGNVELVEALLNVKFNKADPNVLCERYKNDNPDTPLRVAARQQTKGADYPTIIRLLVESGADINSGGQGEEYSRKSHTPLMILAYQNNPRMDIFDALLECGADVNKQDFFKNTALHIAIENNRLGLVSKLLQKGAKVSLVNKNGDTPLHCAVSRGNICCIKLLLQLRADIKTVNNEGATPLDMALKSKNKHMVSVLQAHVSSDLSRGNIARASAKEALSASGTSIKKKEESLVVDGNGNTDLHLAVERPNKYVVELLKKKVRADVSIANNDGDTPLHLAAKKKRVVFVRTLLAKGADASIRNRNGKTPMDVAPTNKMKALFEKKTPKCKKNKK